MDLRQLFRSMEGRTGEIDLTWGDVTFFGELMEEENEDRCHCHI